MECQCVPATVILGHMAEIEQEVEYPFLIGGCRLIDCILVVYFQLYFWQRHFGPGQSVRLRFPDDFQGVVIVYDGNYSNGKFPLQSMRSINCTDGHDCAQIIQRTKWSHLTIHFTGRRKSEHAPGARILVKGFQIPRPKLEAAFVSVLHYSNESYCIAVTVVALTASVCLWLAATMILNSVRYSIQRLLDLHCSANQTNGGMRFGKLV